MNTFFNVSFLFLCCVAASTNHAVAAQHGVPDDSILCPGQPIANYCDCTGDCTEKSEWCQCAEAQECCGQNSFEPSFVIGENGIPDDSILCPGQPTANYCDCDGDCTEKPEWCQCAEAQACCDQYSPEPSFLLGDDGIPGDSILCPGQPIENYCDCTGDCTEKPEWCQCAEAQECCDQNTFQFSTNNNVVPSDSILCPGQPMENYCDCTGDCNEQPQWCQCAEAKECCAEYSSSTGDFGLGKVISGTKAKNDFLLPIGLAIGALLTYLIFKIRSLVRRNKANKPKTWLSETAANVAKPATSDEADDEETVASSSTILDE